MTMKFEVPINILTPIHIGTNETYTNKEYYWDDDEILRINMAELYVSLNEDSQIKFIDYIQDENSSLNDLDSNVELLNYSKYSIINKISQQPKFFHEFECAIKSLNKLYIPGSSIKGSIINALFFNAVQYEDIPKIVYKIIHDDYKNLFNSYFSLDFFEHQAQSSIMRFLQISDTNFYQEPPHLHELIQLNVSKRKKPKLYERKFGKRFVETIPEFTSLKTTISFNYKNDLFSKLNYDENIMQVLNINNLVESLVSFADAIIDFEIDYYSKFQKHDLIKFYRDLMEENYYNKPLILFGSGTGIHTKTIYLKIYEYDKDNGTNYCYDVGKKLFNLKNNIFPKSRRVLAEGNKSLGWAQLDFSEYISNR